MTVTLKVWSPELQAQYDAQQRASVKPRAKRTRRAPYFNPNQFSWEGWEFIRDGSIWRGQEKAGSGTCVCVTEGECIRYVDKLLHPVG